MTYTTGVRQAPAHAAAYTQHLLEQTLPAEQMELAEYYARGAGTREALDLGMGAVPMPRADMHPEMAKALALTPGKFVKERELQHVLAGLNAAGEDLPGSQRDVRSYAAPGAEAVPAGDSSDEGLTVTPGQKPRHRIAWMDCTFSAPKSVSLAWAFAPSAAERNSILAAHHKARDEALAYLEREILGKAGFGRGHRQGGTEDGHLAWIVIDHATARPTVEVTRPDPTTGVVATELHTVRPANGKVAGDPQLHSHCIIPNIMLTESGRWLSINRDRIENRVHEAGAVYQALLARELRALGIGVSLDPRTLSAKVDCIPDHVCEEFSKRTRDAAGAAREEATRRGLDWDSMDADQKVSFLKGGAGASRKSKADDLANLNAWHEQAQRLGWDHRTAITPGPLAPDERTADARLDQAYDASLPILQDELHKRAVVWGADARVAAARGLIAAGIETTADVQTVTERMAGRGVLQDGRKTALVWTEPGEARAKITTALHIELERELVRLVRAAAADKSAALTRDELRAAVKRTGTRFEGENGEERKAAILAMGEGGRFGMFVGAAGVAKTTGVLPVLVSGWQAQGRRVYGTALAHRQATDLVNAGIAPRDKDALEPFLKRLAEGDIVLNRKSVIVIDELSQIGTRQFLELMRYQAASGCQVVGTGDNRQCQSIEAGAIMDLVERALPPGSVPEILATIRQRTAEARHIAGLFREGTEAATAEGLTALRQAGNAELVPGGYLEATRRAAALYVDRERANHNDPDYRITMSAPSNTDALAISREVQRLRRDAGLVTGPSVTRAATDNAGQAYSLTVQAGDTVRLFQRTRAQYPQPNGRYVSTTIGDNGAVLQVLEVRRDGLVLRADREDAKPGLVTWEALTKKGSDRISLALGYCRTIDSSQGLTSDEHISVMPAGSKAVTGFKGYVQASRHRVAHHLVGSAGAELREVMDRAPSGAPVPEGKEAEAAAWSNMARNLARQPIKELALSMIGELRAAATAAGSALREGLRVVEARQAQGQAGTLAQRFNHQRAAAPVAAAAAAAQAAVAGQASLVQALEANLRKSASSGNPLAPKSVPQSGTAPAPTPAPRPAPRPLYRIQVSEADAAVQLADAMRMEGLKPPPVIKWDGKLHLVAVDGNRGRARSGAYRAHLDERGAAAALYNYKRGGWVANWKATGEAKRITPEELAAIEARRRADQAREAAERQARELAAAQRASWMLEGCRPATAAHPYLKAKGVEAHGVYQDLRGRLVVPLRDAAGQLWNLQTIDADGTKLYLGGAKKIGTMHMLGAVQAGKPVGIAEGYATAASVHQASGMAVAVALDTSNLKAVTAALRARLPDTPLVLMADNDHHLPLRNPPLENAGMAKAADTAAATGALIAGAPELAARAAAGKGTDWNDFHAARGMEELRRRIVSDLAALGLTAAIPQAAMKASPRRL